MIRINAPDEYIKYPRPWVCLAGEFCLDWKEPVCEELQDPVGTILLPQDDNLEWSMLALWSCDIIVFWLENDDYSPLFELGTHTARYFTSQGKTPPTVIGIDPTYLKFNGVEDQIKILNQHIKVQLGGCPIIPVVHTLEDLVKGVKEQVGEIQGRVQNIPICEYCYKTIPCGEHVLSFLEEKAKRKRSKHNDNTVS